MHLSACGARRSVDSPMHRRALSNGSERVGSVRFRSRRRSTIPLPHNRRKSKMPAIVHPSSTACSTRASRVNNLDLVIELWKSLGHAPRHEAENLRVPVQPRRPNHCPPRTIWLCYNGILGNVDQFPIDPNAIVTVLRFPTWDRERPTLAVRTTSALFAGQLFKPFVKWRIGIFAIANAGMR